MMMCKFVFRIFHSALGVQFVKELDTINEIIENSLKKGDTAEEYGRKSGTIHRLLQGGMRSRYGFVAG